MAMLHADTINALNALLEDERASVEMEVALASDATEYVEREALTAMGSEDAEVCCLLRERMERLELAVTRRINGIVFVVLGLERYDDRLRAFAQHQQVVVQRVDALLAAEPEGLDRELHRILMQIRDSHTRHILWCQSRAEEFAASRLLEPRMGPGGAPGRGLEYPGGRGTSWHAASPTGPESSDGGHPSPPAEFGTTVLDGDERPSLPPDAPPDTTLD